MLINDDFFKGKIRPESVDLLFTDPPYFLSKKQPLVFKCSGYKTPHEAWDMGDKTMFNYLFIEKAYDSLKKGGNLVVCGSMHNIYDIGHLLENYNEMKIMNHIVWHKPGSIFNATRRCLRYTNEHLIWAVKGKGYTFNYEIAKEYNKGTQLGDLWTINKCCGKERYDHPTQKPLALAERVIRIFSNKGDVVLDPFMGTGTFPLMAKQLGRKYIGVEKEEKYFKIAEARINGTKSIYENGVFEL